MNQVQKKLNETITSAKNESDALNAALKVSLQETEEAQQEAIKEKDKATKNAQLFSAPCRRKRRVQRAAAVERERDRILQVDTGAKKDSATLGRDKERLDAATKSLQDLSADAAQKSAQAFAVMGAVRIISTNQISRSDLFDVSAGAQVTGSSAASNPTDMFNGGQGSAQRATMFADGQPMDTVHWIEWRTKGDVTVKSVGVFAAHEAINFRRAFSNFKLFAKKQNKWVEIAQYSPGAALRR